MRTSVSVSCPPNIGRRERRKRLVLGFVMSAVAAAAAALLLAADAARVWRGLLFLPLVFGALGFYQAEAGTCVVLAARGVRDLDRGIEPVNQHDRRAIQTEALRVTGRAVVTAAVLTAALLVLP